MSGFTLSEDAEADLLKIWDYVYEFQFSDTRADKTIRDIYGAFVELAEFPGMGTERDRFGPGTRAFPRGNYLILFRPVDSGIEIVRVTGADSDLLSGA